MGKVIYNANQSSNSCQQYSTDVPDTKEDRVAYLPVRLNSLRDEGIRASLN